MEWLGHTTEKDPVLESHLVDLLGDLSQVPYNSIAGWYRWYHGSDNSGGFPFGQDCVGKLEFLINELSNRQLNPEVYFLKSNSVVAGMESPVAHFIALVGGFIIDPFAHQLFPIHLSDLVEEGYIATQGVVQTRGFCAEYNDNGAFSTSMLQIINPFLPRRLITNTYYPQELLERLPTPQEYVRFNVPFEYNVILDEVSPYRLRIERKGNQSSVKIIFNSKNRLDTEEEVEQSLIETYRIDFNSLIDYFQNGEAIHKYILYWLQHSHSI